MKRFKIRSLLPIAALVGWAVAPCFASVFVDTISTGAAYQIGGQITHAAQLGFDLYPFSGDFTGTRPVSANGGVTTLGTTACLALSFGSRPTPRVMSTL